MEHVTKSWWLWAKRCLAPDPRPTPLLSRAVPKTAVSMPPVTGLQHLHRHTNLFQSSLRYPQWCLVPTLMIIWVEQQVQRSHLFYSWTWHSAPLWYDLNWLFSTIKILSLKEFYPLIQNEIHSLTWHTWQRLCLWLLCDCTMRFEEQAGLRLGYTVAHHCRRCMCIPLRCSTCWESCNPCTRQTSTGSPEDGMLCKWQHHCQLTFRWICIWQFIVVKLSLNDSSSFWFSSYCFSMSNRSA